jgi:hypothetical protein
VAADSFWTPGKRALRRLQQRLSQRLQDQHPSSNATLHRYSRQYLGLYRADRKFVFVAGAHESYLGDAVKIMKSDGFSDSQAVRRARQWFQEQALSVCDGGEMFFRAEYDLDADSIVWFEFNGQA